MYASGVLFYGFYGLVLGLLYLLTPGHRPEGRVAAGSAALL